LLEAWLNKKVVGSLNRQGGACPVLHELVHGRARTEKTDVTNGNHKEQRKWKGERAEKEEQLTTRTRACSGKLEEGQSGWIPLET
jgi:hypothetical protein